MPRIVAIRAAHDQVLERVRAVRAAGGVPLVGDVRWSEQQWAALHAAADGSVPEEAGWATMTSGSSGAPRILVRTAASWGASFPIVSDILAASTADGVVLPAPPSSSLTMFSIAHALGGGPVPLLRPAARRGRGATVFHGTPEQLREMLDADDSTSIRVALIGGSSLASELRAAAESRGIRVVAYYGAAELSFVALDCGEGLQPFPGVEIDIRDGELWVRSPFIALGYLGAQGPLRRDGSWATVGDLATIEGGALRLRGRADGAIMTASATVIPEEVETVVRSLPGIADGVVFGLPVSAVGALVAAYVELDGEAAPLGQIRAEARARLAPSSVPRVWFAGSLPRTTAGKVARAEARRRAIAGEVRRLVG